MGQRFRPSNYVRRACGLNRFEEKSSLVFPQNHLLIGTVGSLSIVGRVMSGTTTRHSLQLGFLWNDHAQQPSAQQLAGYSGADKGAHAFLFNLRGHGLHIDALSA